MKKLTQYQYACSKAMYEFINNHINLDTLLSKLKEVEDYHREEIGDHDSDKHIWFRFFKGDTMVTTLKNLENDLSSHLSIKNHQFMMELMKDAVNDASLEVYYS